MWIGAGVKAGPKLTGRAQVAERMLIGKGREFASKWIGGVLKAHWKYIRSG